MYTGLILLRSVFSIRRYFAERKAFDFINTPMLVRHAVAFGLYMLTVVLYNASMVYWGWTQTAQTYYIATICGTLFNIGSTISQVLLCQIMWTLGTKKP